MKTAVEPTIARTGDRPKAAVRTTCVASIEEGEPDDLRDEHEDRGRRARPRAVVAADDFRERDGRLPPHPPGEKEPEG